MDSAISIFTREPQVDSLLHYCASMVVVIEEGEKATAIVKGSKRSQGVEECKNKQRQMGKPQDIWVFLPPTSSLFLKTRLVHMYCYQGDSDVMRQKHDLMNIYKGNS